MIAIIVNLAIQLIGGMVIGSAKAYATVTEEQEVYYNLAFMIILQIGNLMVFRSLILKKQIKPVYSVFNEGIKAKKIGISAVVAVLTFIALFIPTIFIANILESIGLPPSTLKLGSIASYAIAVPLITILAPFAEELIFRNAIFSGLLQDHDEYKAVLLCGFVFSIMHMNAYQTFYQFFLGVVAAYFVLRGSHIVYGMIIHAVSNVLGLLVGVPQIDKSLTSFTDMLNDKWWLAIILTIVLFAGLGFCIYTLGKFMRTKSDLAAQAEFDKVKEELDKKENGEDTEENNDSSADKDTDVITGGKKGIVAGLKRQIIDPTTMTEEEIKKAQKINNALKAKTAQKNIVLVDEEDENKKEEVQQKPKRRFSQKFLDRYYKGYDYVKLEFEGEIPSKILFWTAFGITAFVWLAMFLVGIFTGTAG